MRAPLSAGKKEKKKVTTFLQPIKRTARFSHARNIIIASMKETSCVHTESTAPISDMMAAVLVFLIFDEFVTNLLIRHKFVGL